jgi:lipopolysaccharide heptosyltransferase II
MTPQRILLLPICGLGDAVFYAPYLRAVREQYTNAEITVIVATAAARAILQQASENVEIIVFNRSQEKRPWMRVLKLVWAIRRRKFDLVISGAHQNSARVPLFAFLSGAQVRVGARSEKMSFLYSRFVDVPTTAHYKDRYRALLKAAGVHAPAQRLTPTLAPPPEAKAAALRLWREAGLQDAELVIAMVSGADTNSRSQWQPYLKRWNNEGYAEVAKWAARELDARVVMIGSASESVHADEIAALSGVPIVNWCGKTGLKELQWIISKCAAIISNDTGTMHLAGALGTQVLALFGPTSAASFKPPGENNRIIQGHAPCSPCYPHPTCDLSSCLAMNNIAPPQVIEGLTVLLSSRKNVTAPQK